MGIRRALIFLKRSLSGQSTESSYSAAGEDTDLLHTAMSDDVLIYIFNHVSLGFDSLAACRRVCRRWKELIENNDLLRRKSEAQMCHDLTGIPRTHMFMDVAAVIPIRNGSLYAKGFPDGSVVFGNAPFGSDAAPRLCYQRVHPSAICEVKVAGNRIHFHSVTAR
jgi:hypothetical protein